MAYALSSGFQGELEDVVTMDSGRLGILTELPQTALHITGETRIDGDVAINQGSLSLGGYEALVPSVSMVGAGLQAALDSPTCALLPLPPPATSPTPPSATCRCGTTPGWAALTKDTLATKRVLRRSACLWRKAAICSGLPPITRRMA